MGRRPRLHARERRSCTLHVGGARSPTTPPRPRGEEAEVARVDEEAQVAGPARRGPRLSRVSPGRHLKPISAEDGKA